MLQHPVPQQAVQNVIGSDQIQDQGKHIIGDAVQIRLRVVDHGRVLQQVAEVEERRVGDVLERPAQHRLDLERKTAFSDDVFLCVCVKQQFGQSLCMHTRNTNHLHYFGGVQVVHQAADADLEALHVRVRVVADADAGLVLLQEPVQERLADVLPVVALQQPPQDAHDLATLLGILLLDQRYY